MPAVASVTDRAAVAVDHATAALTRLRRGRLLHPAGRCFAGEVTVWGTPGRPFDLLVSSSGAAPVLRHLPLPRRRFAGTYSTVVSFRTGRRRLLLAALADPESPDLGRSLAEVAAAARADAPRLVLAVASAVGPWR
ncbi:phosphodiesterase, partial [Micromonospora sp. NPDC000018]